MDNTSNKRIIILIFSVIVLMIVFGLAAFYVSKPKKAELPPVAEKGPEYRTVVATTTVTLLKDNHIVQQLPVDEDAFAALDEGFVVKDQLAITDQDINFDGHNDLAMLTGIGYGGVNMFYDYYIFNPSTDKFEKSDILSGIGNPEFDKSERKISSSYRSGPQWHSELYVFNGSTYVEASSTRP
jgi:hypothetical protein